MTMAMRRFDRVVLAVHDAAPPTDDEWLRWIALCLERKGAELRVMVESLGGGPSPKQRKELADLLSGEDLRSAILTDSIVTRGVVTAISWLNISLRAFELDQHQAAANYLGLSQAELSEALATFRTLRKACSVGELKRRSTG
jgi:hypothetical protein